MDLVIWTVRSTLPELARKWTSLVTVINVVNTQKSVLFKLKQLSIRALSREFAGVRGSDTA
jgi:hypothetical protein